MEGSFSGSGGGVGAKRIPCRHWSRGNCNLGASCKFLHLGPAGTGPGHLRATTTSQSSGPSTAAQTAFQQAQAAAFTIGQSVAPRAPAPAYNPGASGPPAPQGRIKTVICKKYDTPEGCPFGERCTFAHGQHELGTQSKSNPLYKTVLCEQFKEAEYCERGAQCNFAHGTDELRAPGPGAATFKMGYKSTLCRNWATGQCTYGAACQFAHGEGELRRDSIANGNGGGPPVIGPQGAPGRQGPSYKTTICKSWAESGSCPYGGACLFAHGEGEKRSEGQQYKTVLCKNWEASGTCQWGEQCKWAHGREDLRSGSGPKQFGGGPSAWAGSSSQYKTVLCSKWGQGLCTYGTKCMFAHGTNELRSANGGGGTPKVTSPQYKTVLCQQFMEGKGCQFGESCSFAHGHAEIRNVQMNLAALNPNYKGTLCKYFMTTGECEFGSICQYAHGNMELRRNPSMGGMGGMGGGGNQHFSHMGGGGNQNFSHMGGGGPASPQWKTTLCKNYQEDGRCEFGARCQFAHGQLELRTLAQNYLQLNPQYKTILCSHFAEGGSGNCPQGNNCQFSHGPHELRGHQPDAYNHQQHPSYATGYGNGYGGGSKPTQTQQQNSGKPVKVVLCERFSQGHCDRGASCQFAHGLQELHIYRARQRLSLLGPNNNWIPPHGLQKVPNYKTTLCKSWSAAPGSCEYGETCMYAHGAAELRGNDGKDRRADTGQQEPDSKRMRI